MRRFFYTLSLGLLATACQSATTSPEPKDTEGDPVAESPPSRPAASVTFTGDTLVFPPDLERRPRRVLPKRLAEVEVEASTSDDPFAVTQPALDEHRHTEFVGQRLHVRFNRHIKTQQTPKLTIVPAVEGNLQWEGDWGFTYTAKQPFDPDQTYTLTLEGITAESGDQLDPWTATFRADPRIRIADKVISYIPDPKAPKILAVEYIGNLAGVRPTIEVLFDQPVERATIEDLVHLTRDTDARNPNLIPLVLKKPKHDRFDGVSVDRSYIVAATPKADLIRGEDYVLTARDHGQTDEDDETNSVHFKVATELALSGIECNYDHDCSWSDTDRRLKLSNHQNSIALGFNNPIRAGNLKSKVRVSPSVRNLSVYNNRWNGQITLSGAFEPSKQYTVSIQGLQDDFGSTIAQPIRFTVETPPLAASASFAEQQSYLSAAMSRNFEITTRNVKKAQLVVWEVKDTDASWIQFRGFAARRDRPSPAADLSIDIPFDTPIDRDVTSHINLLNHLTPGRTYLIQLKVIETAHEAGQPDYPSWSWAAKNPTALITVHNDHAIAVHTRLTRTELLVHAARAIDGSPIAQAQVYVDESPVGKTDTQGALTLKAPKGRVVRVVHDGNEESVHIDEHGVHSTDLTGDLEGSSTPSNRDNVGLLISDRGIFRPGATMHFKAMFRHREHQSKLVPMASTQVRFTLNDPNGREVHTSDLTTDEMGTVAIDVPIAAKSAIGRYRAVIMTDKGQELADTQVQVAEFEPPRFKVDVASTAEGKALTSTIEARYLFGAPMAEGDVHWSIRRSSAAFPSGPLVARGLNFHPSTHVQPWLQTGVEQLDDHGQFKLERLLEVDENGGPQRFQIEAEVTDASYRSIANRDTITIHPQANYAGIRVTDRWLQAGENIPFEVGVIDNKGATVTGKPIQVSMEHLDWKRIRKPGPGNSVRIQWKEVHTPAGRCTVTSAEDAVSCPLVAKNNGTYRITTTVDGHAGGTTTVWAWGSGGRNGAFEPKPGHRVEMFPSQKTFSPGESAEVVVNNPFAEATAIWTIEQGDVLYDHAEAVVQGPIKLNVDIKDRYAPYVHATVTLLPKTADPNDVADWKFGAVRLPVDMTHRRLDVTVDSDAPVYEPGQTATVNIHVTKGGQPVANADIALAVVDEGILRMTNFHAADPMDSLYPGVGLHYTIADSRFALSELLERQRVGGGGFENSASASVVNARKNFVKTALWRPNLRTDAHGKVDVSFKLPDNLTEFRMMAVVLDRDGRSGTDEDSFEVRKPLQGIPIVPRFALVHDSFEAAIMVHNGTENATTATVKLSGLGTSMEQTISLTPRGRQRVAFELEPAQTGAQVLTYDVLDDKGVVRDRVEAKLPVQAPGIAEVPRLAGWFKQVQEVNLQVPAAISTDFPEDAFLTLTIGANIYPELGARLEYLIDYPHGCVEQTTSSTLPLLAARDILPRMGLFSYKQETIDAFIKVGVDRLASMQTSRGGLGYWPGAYEPNVYGTAYAMHAISRAKQAGVTIPPGLFEGMTEYLREQMLTEYYDVGPEVRASIALALAEADQLPPSSADMLMDTVDNQGTFGLANLALALSTLEGQDERVKTLLDKIESAFEADGRLKPIETRSDYAYFGSDQRTRAQALLALSQLRPNSSLIPPLVEHTIKATDSYTTQATAFGLLALSEHIKSLDSLTNEVNLAAVLAGTTLKPSDIATSDQTATVYKIPFSDVAGKTSLLRLESDSERPVAFLLEADWRRHYDDPKTLVATSAKHGPEVYRMYSDPKGNPIDLEHIEAGQLIRVALLARLAGYDNYYDDSADYLAITDRIPAGFEPVQPDLWTVGTVPDITNKHPLYNYLAWRSPDASHVELRDDRVNLYFDDVWSEYVAASYMIRATTPGTFGVPPAMAELMYQGDSTGYSEDAQFTVIEP